MIVGMAACAALFGCGGAQGPGRCTVTLSGAQTGTYDCTMATAAWEASSNQSAIGFGSSGTPQIGVSLGVSGAPRTGTFASTDAGAQGVIDVAAAGSSSPSWSANVSGGSALGAYTLVLTGVTELAATASGKGYTVHGTLSATLPATPGSGASGTVSLQASF